MWLQLLRAVAACLDTRHRLATYHTKLSQHWMTQVLANPTADIQEGPKIGRGELKARGVRPYDEKVQPALLGLHMLSVNNHLCPLPASSAGHAQPSLAVAFITVHSSHSQLQHY